MDAFFENAQKIFDVARSNGSGELEDFALLIGPDGGLHLVMDSSLSLEAAAVHGGARTAYHVTRSASGVRVSGQTAGRTCVLESRKPEIGQLGNRGRSNPALWLLRDQPLYQMSPGSGGGSSADRSGSGNLAGSGGLRALPMLAA